MKRLLSMPIRRQILILIISMMVVPVLLIIYSATNQRARDIQEANLLLEMLADQISNDQRMMLSGAEQLLSTLAYIPSVQKRESAAVQKLLAELIRINPQYSNLILMDNKGMLWASAVPVNKSISYSDRRYFRNAMSSGRFSSGEFGISRTLGNPVMNFSYPIKDAAGTITDLAVVAFTPDKYAEKLRTASLPANTSLLLTDHKGVILFRLQADQLIGKQDRDDLFRRMSEGPEAGTFKAYGNTGDQRYYAYAKLSLGKEQTPYMYVRTGIPVDAVHKKTTMQIIMNAGIMSSIMLLSLALAVYITRRGIIDKIETLSNATKKMALGNLEVRVSDQLSGGELGELGESFDQMSRRLAEEMAELNRNIVQRLQAENDLKESRQQLLDIIDFLPDATLVIDSDKRVIAWNKAIEEMSGVCKEEILGLGDYAYSIPFYGERRPNLLDLLDMNDEELSSKYSGITRKGETLYAEAYAPALYGGKGSYIWAIASPLYNGEGKKVGYIESIRDITEKKISEDAIRLNEARLESLLRISQHRNIPVSELLDHTLAEAIQLTQSEFGYIYNYDETTRQFTLNSWSKGVMDVCIVMEKQTVYSLESTGLWGEAVRQRQPIIVNDYSAPNSFKKGHPEGHAPLSSFMTIPVILNDKIVSVVGVANKKSSYDDSDIRQLRLLMDAVWNIIEQQNAEELRSHDLALIESLLNNSPAGIRVFDAESGKCVLVNQSAAAIAGGSREELLEQNFRLLKSWEETGLSTLAELVLSEGAPRRIETQMRTSFGKELAVAYQLSRFIVHDRLNLLVIGRDITEERRLAEERKSIEEQMLHAQKLESLGVLAGGIAHDFNNILMAIMGNADLALMRINRESPATENLHMIEKAAARAADLAKQMLAYSGKGKFIVENIDLNLLLQDMLHMLEVSISKKAVLRLNLHRSLPLVEADATQMRQIVMNLVINASEAIGDKSGVIAITSGCMDCDRSYLKDVWLDENLADGLYVYLEIADSGCGMGKETMGKLFDPFFTTKFTGRGLGMAAVLGIVRGHKGAIKVYSEPDKGTTFKLLFPATGKAAEHINDKSHKDDWQGSGTVLLVDDEEIVRGIGSEMLRELGFSVITANDGREAVAIFRNTPDIAFVILDLTMPHMDGEQCFRELRQLAPDVKVIMSSGYNEQEVTRKFFGKGLAGFIQKPYKTSLLKEAIKRFT